MRRRKKRSNEDNPEGLFARISAGITWIFSRRGVQNVISGLFSMVTMWSFHFLVERFPDRAFWLAERITEAYYTPPEEWAGFVSRYLERMTGARISIEDIKKEGFGIGSRGPMQALGDRFFTPMFSLIMPKAREDGRQLRIHPEEGLKAAHRFLAVNLQFQMSAWLLHMLGDIKSFGIFKSLKDLPNAISWSFGIGWLSWLVMGVPFRKGISEPLEVMYNRLYRPQLLTKAEYFKAYHRGLLGKKALRERLADLGYADDLIAVLATLEREMFTDTDLSRLFEAGFIDESDIFQVLRDRGHRKDDAAVLAKEITTRRRRKIIDDICDTAERLYRKGRIDESLFRQFLERGGLRPEEIDLKVIGANLYREHAKTPGPERRFLTPADLRRVLEAGLRDRPWIIKRLLELGFTEEDANLYLDAYKK